MIMRTLLTSLIALYSFAASAEGLPDPTMPPSFILGTGAGTTAPGQWSTQSRSTGLQTIIISKSRRAAIIDGQTVELGAKHGSATLVEINEGSVILQGGQSRQLLTLFPGVTISRKAEPSKGSQETQPSSANKAQSGENNNMPTAHEEEK